MKRRRITWQIVTIVLGVVGGLVGTAALVLVYAPQYLMPLATLLGGYGIREAQHRLVRPTTHTHEEDTDPGEVPPYRGDKS